MRDGDIVVRVTIELISEDCSSVVTESMAYKPVVDDGTEPSRLTGRAIGKALTKISHSLFEPWLTVSYIVGWFLPDSKGDCFCDDPPSSLHDILAQFRDAADELSGAISDAYKKPAKPAKESPPH